MTIAAIKIIGLVATAISVCASLTLGWVNDKKMEKTIEDKVDKALAKKSKKES